MKKKTLSKKELYTTIYKRFVAGQTLTQIASSIGYDKGYVSRIKTRLVQAGYLIPVNPRSRAVMYEATKKKFTGEVGNSLTDLTGGRRQQLRHRRELVKVQKATFICDVVSVFGKKVKWDKEGTLRNGVRFFDFVYPFANVGEIRFRRFKGRSVDRLLVITPTLLWEDDAGDPLPFLEQVARFAVGWFGKRFKVRLEGIERCQKPHYAKALSDPRLIHMAQSGSFNVDGLMVDSSAPDGTPEIETDGDWVLLQELSRAPDRIVRLEERVKRIEGVVESLSLSVERLYDVITSDFSDGFKSRVDEFRDVV